MKIKAYLLAPVLSLMLGSILSPPARGDGELWDDNDYIIADFDALVILDENFNFKAAQPTCGPICGHGFGSLDWFANGDVLTSLRDINSSPLGASLRYSRNGVQLAYYPSPAGADTKLSFNQNDIIVGTLVGKPAVQRFVLGGGTQESGSFSSYGGVAVVPKADDTHEVWAAAEGEVGGIHIFPMEASGAVRFDQAILTSPIVDAGSSTMTYDPATRRVLFSNLSDGQILAMDVETRRVVKTYAIPADQKPVDVQFTGITAGPNGIIIGVESYDYFLIRGSSRRVGLSVWDADGTNYRFINLDGLPGYDLFDPDFSGRVPINILWTGNSPEFRNEAPLIACPGAVVLACATPAGLSQDITAFVTDPSAGQTLTVSLKEGDSVLEPAQTLATPAANKAVTFGNVLFLPGQHLLTLEASDGKLSASCGTQVTVYQDTTAPVLSGAPEPITVTATSQSGAQVSYTPPAASDACAGSVPVSCAPASGSLFPIGTTPVSCAATDALGNSGTATFQVTVEPMPMIGWSGVQEPLNADGSSVFKAGSVVPVKFYLTGDNVGRPDLIARLSYAKVSSNVAGSVNEADAPGNGTSGNVFLYDPATGQYYFNWSTKGLAVGIYELIIDLGDGNPRRVGLGLR